MATKPVPAEGGRQTVALWRQPGACSGGGAVAEEEQRRRDQG